MRYAILTGSPTYLEVSDDAPAYARNPGRSLSAAPAKGPGEGPNRGSGGPSLLGRVGSQRGARQPPAPLGGRFGFWFARRGHAAPRLLGTSALRRVAREKGCLSASSIPRVGLPWQIVTNSSIPPAWPGATKYGNREGCWSP